jgi:hypothetical protein
MHNRNGISFGTFIYLVIGFIVAANRGYFANVSTIEGILSAILAVLLWPLLLFGISVHIGVST